MKSLERSELYIEESRENPTYRPLQRVRRTNEAYVATWREDKPPAPARESPEASDLREDLGETLELELQVLRQSPWQPDSWFHSPCAVLQLALLGEAHQKQGHTCSSCTPPASRCTVTPCNSSCKGIGKDIPQSRAAPARLSLVRGHCRPCFMQIVWQMCAQQMPCVTLELHFSDFFATKLKRCRVLT